MKNILYVVICIDTEGPLTESLKATFERINYKFNLSLKPSISTLRKLQSGKKTYKKFGDELRDFVNPKRLNYLNNWKEISKMVKKITSNKFRKRTQKFFRSSLKYSWFIIDNVGFKFNPRRKALGFNAVFHNYEKILNKYSKKNDCIGWHFHSIHPSGNPLIYNTSWTSNDLHEKSLCMRLIEKKNFPNLFRAGALIERNDLSQWLENFIPFDFSNRSRILKKKKIEYLNDWYGAPYDWSPYNPSFYDYKSKGSMNRTIFRTLDIDTNSNVINQKEIHSAFKRSKKNKTILSVSTHDRRDIEPELTFFLKKLEKVSKKYPKVKIEFTTAENAARKVLKINENKNRKKILYTKITDKKYLDIKTNFDLFGNIPFLAIKEKNNLIYRDNPIKIKKNYWRYLVSKNIKTLGIATVDKKGFVKTRVHEI